MLACSRVSFRCSSSTATVFVFQAVSAWCLLLPDAVLKREFLLGVLQLNLQKRVFFGHAVVFVCEFFFACNVGVFFEEALFGFVVSQVLGNVAPCRLVVGEPEQLVKPFLAVPWRRIKELFEVFLAYPDDFPPQVPVKSRDRFQLLSNGVGFLAGDEFFVVEQFEFVKVLAYAFAAPA